jgi:uncharacterized protein
MPSSSRATKTSCSDQRRVASCAGRRSAWSAPVRQDYVGADYLRTVAGQLFDLENPADLARLEQPMSALDPLRGLIVIDEIQRRPDLFPVLRVLVDHARSRARFLILGSASPELMRQGSETLAGRIAFVEMEGFDLDEVGADTRDGLWLDGLPRSYLARSARDSSAWREDFIRTFLERDIRALGFNVLPLSLRRLWMMLAHNHGQVLNASEIARSLGEWLPGMTIQDCRASLAGA